MASWNWRAEGFRTEPARVVAAPGLALFRAWGGAASKAGSPHRPGVCFSAQKPTTRAWAERLFSVWEWGNSCLWVTEFSVTPGTPLWVGRVDIGDYVDQSLMEGRGIQVFVEQPVEGRVTEIRSERLADDLGGAVVGPGSRSTH